MLHTSAGLRENGFSHDDVRREVRRERLHRVHRGVYSDEPPVGERVGHTQLIAATPPLCAPDSVISHRSAAVLWGLPLVGPVPGDVEVTRTSVNSGKHRGGIHLRVAGLSAPEITVVTGFPVTTLARTVVDLARSLSFGPAVAVGDAALRAGLTADELDASLESARKRRGIAAARRVCAFLDPRSESPGESLSRVKIADCGLPRPALQVGIRDRSGRLIARTDFGWETLRTVGEFDGRVKYEALLRPGQSASDVVVAEKQREDRIRSEGLSVVRWGWDELGHFAPVADRLRRAFALAR